MIFGDIIHPVYYVPMPLDADGMGPVTMDRAVRVQHEIWDQNNLTIATVCDRETAEFIVEAMNLGFERALHAIGTISFL